MMMMTTLILAHGHLKVVKEAEAGTTGDPKAEEVLGLETATSEALVILSRKLSVGMFWRSSNTMFCWIDHPP